MKHLFTLAFFLCFLLSLKASHNRSGNITYKRIAPFTQVMGSGTVDVYNYRITVTKYSDDGPGIADRCVDTVYFGDGQKGAAPRMNGVVTGCCSASITCGDIIVNNPGFKIKRSIYVIDHTYPGPGTYMISSYDPGRTAGINNIPNSANQAFYLEDMLWISPLSAMNASPVFSFEPIDEASTNNCFYHSAVCTDADGDSLSYQLIPCIGITGYTSPSTTSGGYFFINYQTGLLHWCSPPQTGIYSLAIKVTEWRKDNNGVYQIIGSIMRDMQVNVKIGVVGISEAGAGSGFSVRPNPFAGSFEVAMPGSAKNAAASLYALDGRLLGTKQLSAQNGAASFNTADLGKGVYLLVITNGAQVLHQKIVKE